MDRYIFDYSDIFKILRTTTDLASFITQVDTALSKLFVIDYGKDPPLTFFSPYFQQGLTDSLHKNNVNPYDHEAYKNFLQGLRDKLQGLPTIRLTVALTPQDTALERIAAFLKENFGTECVADISVDPKLGGGAVMSIHGWYIDKSLTTRITDAFMKRNNEIQAILKPKKN